MNKSKETIWDVAVIGGGPAGMMAAGRAAELGAKVILIEKNGSLGKKLLLTGGGRCNLTNAEIDSRKLVEKFKSDGKFLFSTFSKWSVKDTIAFFNARNMPTKTEEEGRVFPTSNKAQSVLNVLLSYMEAGGVTILPNSPVVKIEKNNNQITNIRLNNKKEIFARTFIFATGGKSHPETGSTGEGFAWLNAIGHNIIEPSAALVPVAIRDPWVKKLSGLTLPNIKVTLLQNNKKHSSNMGKVLFAHFGISGPTILNMSKEVGELLKRGEVIISLDLLPSIDQAGLNKQLRELFIAQANKKIKNVLEKIIPSAIVPDVIKLAKVNIDAPCNSITKEERAALIKLLKDIPLHVYGLLGLDKAIITSGGVNLKEVDFKTMGSKLFSNLYFVGDVLNIDRPSGGYSLQICWTTGFVAGDSAGTAALSLL